MQILNLAFEIGFDHYRYSLPLEIIKFQVQYRQEVRNGFEAAKLQGASKKKPDLYEKKLLCIRDRALNKNRMVTITIEDLKHELNRTHGRCPITEEKFTFAENNDTDWSVDRIDNNRGYCPDNIVIVSVIANKAKSNLDLSEIIKTALSGHEGNEFLTGNEWFRLAQFYFKKMSFLKPLHFCQLLTNSQSLFDQLIFLQLFHKKNQNAKIFLKQLENHINKKEIQKAEKLAYKRVYHRADIDVNVVYDSPKLYQSVKSFVKVINQHSNDFDHLLMNCLFA